MACGDNKGDRQTAEELLAAMHEGHVAALSQQLSEQLDALMREHAAELEALRLRSVRKLVVMVAAFERGCAASRARLELQRTRLRAGVPPALAALGKA